MVGGINDWHHWCAGAYRSAIKNLFALCITIHILKWKNLNSQCLWRLDMKSLLKYSAFAAALLAAGCVSTDTQTNTTQRSNHVRTTVVDEHGVLGIFPSKKT